ncbi:MAG: ferredoxin family protein [Polyangiaceae bacterium]|nr:ferredoxin family protein [Polyangiaceae bacterium]
MAYVVGDPCVKCKYTDCVEVCPVDCFYEGENTLVIHPDECIDCGACEPVCPTTAIFELEELPEDQKPYIELNAVFSGAKAPGDADTAGWPQHLVDAVNAGGFKAWPMVNEKREPLPGADDLKETKDKLADFSPNAGG